MQADLLSNQVPLPGQEHDQAGPGQDADGMIKEGSVEILLLLPLSSGHLGCLRQNLIEEILIFEVEEAPVDVANPQTGGSGILPALCDRLSIGV